MAANQQIQRNNISGFSTEESGAEDWVHGESCACFDEEEECGNCGIQEEECTEKCETKRRRVEDIVLFSKCIVCDFIDLCLGSSLFIV